MTKIKLSKISKTLPVSGSIAISQAAAGCALGLLLADKMNKRARKRTSALLLTAGIIASIPLATTLISRLRHRPNSKKAAHRQLESIRDGAGGYSSSESEEVLF